MELKNDNVLRISKNKKWITYNDISIKVDIITTIRKHKDGFRIFFNELEIEENPQSYGTASTCLNVKYDNKNYEILTGLLFN